MKKLYPLLFLLLALAACQSSQKQSEDTETDTEIPAEPEVEQAVEDGGEREPTDDEIREYGLITGINDSPYPRFSVDMEFPERQMKASFVFDVYKHSMTLDELTSLQDQYATIYYVIEDDHTVVDVYSKGERLYMSVSDMDIDVEGADSITGILDGAEEATAGDLPGEFTLTEASGRVTSFKEFIIDELVALNGQEITVYYYESSQNVITYIQPSEGEAN